VLNANATAFLGKPKRCSGISVFKGLGEARLAVASFHYLQAESNLNQWHLCQQQPTDDELCIPEALRFRVFHKLSVTIRVFAALVVMTGGVSLVNVV
jgi:hypothetical protein